MKEKETRIGYAVEFTETASPKRASRGLESGTLRASVNLVPLIHPSITVIWLVVSVPVLSEQISRKDSKKKKREREG